MTTSILHPIKVWRHAASQSDLSPITRLRLAAVSGQMTQDMVVARRLAIVELLAEGRPLNREQIWERVAEHLGEDCWGKRPQEKLLRDLAVLRKGGIRIGYSRQKDLEGYYLKYPAIEKPNAAYVYQEAPTPQILLDAIRQTPIEEKLAAAFSMAQFALEQKRLILTQQHPTLPASDIDILARQQVFGTEGFAK